MVDSDHFEKAKAEAYSRYGHLHTVVGIGGSPEGERIILYLRDSSECHVLPNVFMGYRVAFQFTGGVVTQNER
jgi:hypothetical protein